MKYVLYRSLGNLDNQVKQHELVAVEYGSDIYEVTDALVRDVTDDLAEIPEYHGCVTTAYAPEPIHSFRKVKRYDYEMIGQVWRRKKKLIEWICRSSKSPISVEFGTVFCFCFNFPTAIGISAEEANTKIHSIISTQEKYLSFFDITQSMSS